MSSVRCSQERTTDIWTDHAWTTESVKQKHRSAVGKDVSWNFGVVFRFWTLGLNLVDVTGVPVRVRSFGTQLHGTVGCRGLGSQVDG